MNYRDHFVYVASQWETTLQCNVVSHWLSACTERCLESHESAQKYKTTKANKSTFGMFNIPWQAQIGIHERRWTRFLGILSPNALMTSRVKVNNPHFNPRPVLAFGYCRYLRLFVCVSVCVCINHVLVRVITHHLFKLGSPNLDHWCKRPWLRSLLFWGRLTMTFKVKLNSKVKICPILRLSIP